MLAGADAEYPQVRYMSLGLANYGTAFAHISSQDNRYELIDTLAFGTLYPNPIILDDNALVVRFVDINNQIT